MFWTVNDLMGPHRSRPYNPLIANTFFRSGFIEAWGRGIEKIKDSCMQTGNPLPEYFVKKEDIMDESLLFVKTEKASKRLQPLWDIKQ